MKIAYHDNILSLRGTTVALYDYAYYCKKFLNIEGVILYNKTYNEINIDVYNKFKNNGFDLFSYENKSEIDKILESEKCDSLFAIKAGSYDGVISKNYKNLIMGVGICNHHHIHGDKFAVCSEWLSKMSGNQIPCVPHMISLPENNEDLRSELKIPKDDFVYGRNGGRDTFDISFVKEEIIDFINKNKNVWFLFQNTDVFYNHERIIYLNPSADLEYKVKFINTCDAMLHARYTGESFGISCGEFSSKNKPVITFMHSQEQSHVEILKDKGIYYSNKENIRDIFNNLDKNFINSKNWNAYEDYTPDKVISRFENFYLK